MDTKTNNDKVIKEIPVYLSDDLRHLLLLHYPTRLSKNDQLLSSTVTQCNYKTDCEELELAYALDTNLNYDEMHGKELAVELDKSSKDKSSYPSGMVDQLSFQSHKITTNTIDMIMYASGQSLHLCPLKNSFNMLPKLNHIDKVDPKNDNKKNSQNDNEVSEEEEEEEEESEQVIAKFKDRPSKRNEKKKIHEMAKQRAMEPCIHLNFIPNGQYFSRMELDKFTLPKIRNTTNITYAQETIMEQKIINENIDSIRARQLSHHAIKLYSLENKIKILLLNTKMVSTKTLIDLLHSCGVPTDESVDTILAHLQKIAFFICGNWTIKSEELYPDNTISFHFGLSSEIMRLLRDYIIHLLDSGKTINRKYIGKLFNSPPDEVKDVLNSVAKLNEDKTWRFAITENDDILETNMDTFNAICEEQKEWWVTRVKEIETWLGQKPKTN